MDGLASEDGLSAGVGASRTKTRGLILPLVALLFSSTICLGLLEVTVRVLKRGIAFQPDPDLVRSLRPNVEGVDLSYDSDDNLNGRSVELPSEPILLVSKTNANGLRMVSDVGPKGPNERRVLLFGDSYTEGLAVRHEDRFSELLDTRLRGLTDVAGKWRVINGAIQNGNPSQYLLQAKRYLPEFKPDVVVVFLAPNDVADDLAFERDYGYEFEGNGLPIAPQATTRLWLLQKSYLLRYMQVFLWRVAPKAHDLVFPPAHPDIVTPHWEDMLCRDHPPTRATFRRKTGRYLTELKRLSEAAGAKFAVHLIQYEFVFANEPMYATRYSAMYEDLKARGCYSSAGRHYNEFIESYLREQRVTFRNPYAALLSAKAENPRRKLWLFWDYHYSPAGHRVVADDLFALVRPLLE